MVIIDVVWMICIGDVEVVVVVGMEFMICVLYLLMGFCEGWMYGSVEVFDYMVYDGLIDVYDRESMGVLIECYNVCYEFICEVQDCVVVLLYQCVVVLQEVGVFDVEIVVVDVFQCWGEFVCVMKDEGVCFEIMVEMFVGLCFVFVEGGFIMVGNFFQILDGVFVVVVMMCGIVEVKGWLVFVMVGVSGQIVGLDNLLQVQLVWVIEWVCEKQGILLLDLDFVEINEVFGVVVVCLEVEFGLDDEIVNIYGGGIVIGYFIGVFGNCFVVYIVYELVCCGSGMVVVGLCGGGGQGEVFIFIW